MSEKLYYWHPKDVDGKTGKIVVGRDGDHQSVVFIADDGTIYLLFSGFDPVEPAPVVPLKCDCDKRCDLDAVVSFVDDIEGVVVYCCADHARAYRRNPDTWRETALTLTHQQPSGVPRDVDSLAEAIYMAFDPDVRPIEKWPDNDENPMPWSGLPDGNHYTLWSKEQFRIVAKAILTLGHQEEP